MLRQSRKKQKAIALILIPAVVFALVGPVPLIATTSEGAQVVISNPLGSLKTIEVPQPKNLNQFLKTQGAKGKGIDPRARAAVIALGKALFWDQAAGSDGQACASCHFNAGADSRTRNQLDPGLRAVPEDRAFGPLVGSCAADFAADYQLKVADFPFTRFNNPDDRNSGILCDTNDICSSQGVFDAKFLSVSPSACPDDQPNLDAKCDTFSIKPDLVPPGFFDIFNANGVQVRNVEPRNTPTMINAVFNFRNFWDGRARNEFNGVNPIGDLDPFAKVWLNESGLHQVSLIGNLRLENSSLASQAVGPPLSDMEMSYRDRSFPDIGRKMLALPNALPFQVVHPKDSVLGDNKLAGVKSNSPAAGINKSYAELIQAAFQERWWNGGDVGNGFTQMEANFSLFWGLAVQMYESTLVADDSLLDRAFDAGDPRTCGERGKPACVPGWTPQLKLGLQVFEGAGKCVNCHGGPETTNNSVRNVTNEKLERMLMAEGVAVYDTGFYNTSVRRCVGDIHGEVTGVCDDAAIGTTIGPLNLPLSMSRFFQLVRTDPQSDAIKTVCENRPEACNVPKVLNIPPENLDPNERIAVVGAFKTPGLRNIALQAPFFHNGGDLSLEDIVQFYDRGGNFHDLNIVNLDPDIEDLGLSDEQKAALVALMKAMTDERVRLEKAPFDHPQLFVPDFGELAAVGRNGGQALATFLENLE